MRYLPIIILTILTIGIFSFQDSSLKKYHNKSNKYICYYPSFMSMGPPSQSGDGRNFYNSDSSFTLGIYRTTNFNGYEEAYKSRKNYFENDGGKITYKVFKENWYVISGLYPDSTIYYAKQINRPNDEHQFEAVFIVLRYPYSEREKYNKYCSIIPESLEFVGLEEQ
ncbi:hypothetical protein [Marinigracilibium pacificum]|uniref:Uncharacterized protein n=1 Tax=Marinigracilibium pacificum TaxID=2729599 RepID=A0A848J5F7_9BACT|nr:hypothetical protein [Marinigracilibium pacificum]NMM50478.1 hypothetical protein [Marinigracilibium pacificum]